MRFFPNMPTIFIQNLTAKGQEKTIWLFYSVSLPHRLPLYFSRWNSCNEIIMNSVERCIIFLHFLNHRKSNTGRTTVWKRRSKRELKAYLRENVNRHATFVSALWDLLITKHSQSVAQLATFLFECLWFTKRSNDLLRKPIMWSHKDKPWSSRMNIWQPNPFPPLIVLRWFMNYVPDNIWDGEPTNRSALKKQTILSIR